MAVEGPPSSEAASAKPPEETYFEFLASMGITKHMGSMKATEELIELCHIGEGKHVLDVGCGVGATPCYLAKRYNCRVVGVDLLEKMVEQSRERARLLGVEDRVEFKVADARDLPFEDDRFDAVIAESVNAFFEDKPQAIQEYTRVTKPGGYVGITEMTWLRTPTPEVAEYYLKTVYADALEADGWRELLQGAGLKDVVGNAYKVDIPTESRSRIAVQRHDRPVRENSLDSSGPGLVAPTSPDKGLPKSVGAVRLPSARPATPNRRAPGDHIQKRAAGVSMCVPSGPARYARLREALR